MKNTSHRAVTSGPLLPGLVLAALLAAVGILPAAETAVEPSSKAPVATKRVVPVHPEELYKKLINGRAIVELLVSETGTVQEVKIVSASLPEFGQAAADAVRQWEFQPGEKNGLPVAVRLQIPFEFTLTAQQIIERVAQRQVFLEINDVIIPAKEMPSWPRPLEYLLPRYPESLKGSGKYGKAVVSIIINKEGRVVNPKLVKATYPEFILPALAAAAQLQFPPPVMANNERIHVSMDIQFDFKPEQAKAKPNEKPKEK